MSTLSVIVITLNEERHIAACLESVAWADEIIVVDAESKDETVAIARRFTARVFIEKFRGYSGQKNFALAQARGEWVLWLDADERVTPELAEEIRRTIAAAPAAAGFEMPRKAYFLGRWIRHCGWYPGYVLRLFRRERGRFDDREVHETLLLDGEKGVCAAISTTIPTIRSSTTSGSSTATPPSQPRSWPGAAGAPACSAS